MVSLADEISTKCTVCTVCTVSVYALRYTHVVTDHHHVLYGIQLEKPYKP